MMVRVVMLLGMLTLVAGESLTVNDRDLLVDDPTVGTATAVVMWLHAVDGGVITDRQRFQAAGLADQGVAVAYLQSQPRGWGGDSDREVVMAASKVVRERYDLEPTAVLLVGDRDGAVLAQRLVLDRPYWFAGAVLVGGAHGGAWDRAEKHQPIFGVYANTSDVVVSVHSLRKIEQRLRKSGYPVEWCSEIVDAQVPEGYGDGLFELISSVLGAAGLLASDAEVPPIAAP